MKTIHMPLVEIPSIIIDVPAPVEPGESYTLTVASADTSMGTVSGGGTYAEGSHVTIKATPKSGYRFAKWSDNNTNATRTVTVSADATYTATFEADAPASYTLTVQSNDNSMGTVSGGGTYSSGDSATLTATPKTGCHFVSWQDGNTNATRTVTVTGNATYTATFEADAPAPSGSADFLYGVVDTPSDAAHAVDSVTAGDLTEGDMSQSDTAEMSMTSGKTFIFLYDATKVAPASYTITTELGDDNGSDFDNGRKFYTGSKTIDGVAYTSVELKGGNTGSVAMPVEIKFNSLNL